MNALRETFTWLTSQSLAAYIVRGAIGIGLFAAGFMQVGAYPVLGVTLMFAALVPFGGCPSCWLGGTIGAACAYRPQRPSPPQE